MHDVHRTLRELSAVCAASPHARLAAAGGRAGAHGWGGSTGAAVAGGNAGGTRRPWRVGGGSGCDGVMKAPEAARALTLEVGAMAAAGGGRGVWARGEGAAARTAEEGAGAGRQGAERGDGRRRDLGGKNAIVPQKGLTVSS